MGTFHRWQYTQPFWRLRGRGGTFHRLLIAEEPLAPPLSATLKPSIGRQLRCPWHPHCRLTLLPPFRQGGSAETNEGAARSPLPYCPQERERKDFMIPPSSHLEPKWPRGHLAYGRERGVQNRSGPQVTRTHTCVQTCAHTRARTHTLTTRAHAHAQTHTTHTHTHMPHPTWTTSFDST